MFSNISKVNLAIYCLCSLLSFMLFFIVRIIVDIKWETVTIALLISIGSVVVLYWLLVPMKSFKVTSVRYDSSRKSKNDDNKDDDDDDDDYDSTYPTVFRSTLSTSFDTPLRPSIRKRDCVSTDSKIVSPSKHYSYSDRHTSVSYDDTMAHHSHDKSKMIGIASKPNFFTINTNVSAWWKKFEMFAQAVGLDKNNLKFTLQSLINDECLNLFDNSLVRDIGTLNDYKKKW